MREKNEKEKIQHETHNSIPAGRHVNTGVEPALAIRRRKPIPCDAFKKYFIGLSVTRESCEKRKEQTIIAGIGRSISQARPEYGTLSEFSLSTQTIDVSSSNAQ